MPFASHWGLWQLKPKRMPKGGCNAKPRCSVAGPFCQYPPCEFERKGIRKARCLCVRFWLEPIPTKCSLCKAPVCLSIQCSRVLPVPGPDGQTIRRRFCLRCMKRGKPVAP